ncbi:response regulator transcription factor [Facilibium subflavum]|uniref:response regulator transcription factor n=1 Tax=Facilibium subflavum TaxID=2219058 RepID=UPI000E652A61|nr:response regulator transcription factor [Facilibium subflavum]
MYEKILVVDDDARLREYIGAVLEKYGLAPLYAENTRKAEEILNKETVDLMVLDIMMSPEDGISFCKRIVPKIHIPVIMLTAVDDELDQIVCLEAGAIDYITKPFKPRMLVSKIKSILNFTQRQSEDDEKPEPIQQVSFDKWIVNFDTQSLFDVNGSQVNLSRLEFLLLTLLIKNANKVVSRGKILDALYQDKYVVSDRTIDINISRLRQKLDDKKFNRIKTIHGRGYLFRLE